MPLIFFDILFKYFTTFSTPLFIPSLIDLTLSTNECLSASSNIALANIVAVVVPSPASLTVLCAACLINVAPIFSIGCLKLIALATVTPSFVIIGFPL